ncbi:MAG: hypothetical protein GX763_07355 [Clostridiaceae bacterium]|nr:hypothetical protein [Clostridiaceae bacterium]
MSLKNKKLLLLGGSRNMKEILDVAHDMGVGVGITDWYDSKRSPVKEMADEYFDVSIEDYDGLMDIIESRSYDGVLSGYTDSYLLPYARICQRADLPCYGTIDQFEILTDKRSYKDLFRKYAVPTLPEYKIDDLDENFADYPLLLKPARGSGGKGLVKVDNFEEFLQVTGGRADRDPVDYLIEPYIEERQEMTAFFLFLDGEIYLSGTANRFLSRAQDDKIALPVLYSMPSSYDAAFREKTAPPMIEMFKDLDLRNGILFAQCIVRDNIPLVYDIGFRTTGTLEYKLQESLYGFNPLKIMVHHSLTGENPPNDYEFINENIRKNERYGFNVTILGKAGTISAIEGAAEILKLPQVIDCAFKMVETETISESMIGTLGQIIARIFFTSDSPAEAIEILEEIYQLIHVYDQNGEDMILHRFSPELLLEEYS